MFKVVITLRFHAPLLLVIKWYWLDKIHTWFYVEPVIHSLHSRLMFFCLMVVISSLSFQEALVFWLFSSSLLLWAMVLWPFFFLWYIVLFLFFCSIFQFLKSTCFHFARFYCSNGDILQFVLAATGSGAEQLIFSQRRKWKGVGLGRLPIFYAADTLS